MYGSDVGHNPDERREFSGSVIRFTWVHDVFSRSSLGGRECAAWDANWLRQALGVSDVPIREPRAWAEARDALEATGLAHAQTTSALDAQADNLVTRLRAELQPRLTGEHLR